MIPSCRLRGILPALLVLCSGCTLRSVQSTFEDPRLNDAKIGVPLEGGARMWTGDFLGGQADLQLLGSYQRFDYHTDAVLAHVEFRGRYFPERLGPFRPFVGGGLGTYRLWAWEEDDLNCRKPYICFEPGFDDRRSPASRVNPHVAAGTEVPLRNDGRLALVFAATRELLAKTDEWDPNAWRFSLGLFVVPLDTSRR